MKNRLVFSLLFAAIVTLVAAGPLFAATTPELLTTWPPTKSSPETCETLLGQRFMYPLDELPVGLENCPGWQLIQRHLTRAKTATVKIGHGSGVIIGPNGQLATNWHVALGALAEWPELVQSGCWAANADEALPLDIETLIPVGEPEYEATTARILAAVPGNATLEEAGLARKRAMEEIVAKCEAANGGDFSCSVDEIRPGQRYALYRWRKYNKAELYFLPPESAAYRDADNFEHNEGALRVDYAELQIVAPEGERFAYIPTAPIELVAGQRTFGVSYPYSSRWNLTAADVTTTVAYGEMIIASMERRLVVIGQLGPESQTAGSRMAAENGIKLYQVLFGEASEIEQFRAAREKRLASQLAVLGGLEVLRNHAEVIVSEYLARFDLVVINAYAERGALRDSTNGSRFRHGWLLSRWAHQSHLPEAEREPDFRDPAKVREKIAKIGDAPLDDELVTTGSSLWTMTKYDQNFAGALGDDPDAFIERVIRKTRLGESAFALELFDAGAEAIFASNDPLMKVVRIAERAGWETRSWYAKYSESSKACERLIGAALALAGEVDSANAASHPRLTLGEVRGYRDNGREVAPYTTFAASVARVRTGEIQLPEWLVASAAGDQTVVNISQEMLTTGGSSGSPIFAVRGGQLWVVGLEFDGNKFQIRSYDWPGGSEARDVVVTINGVQRFRQLAGVCEGCGERRFPPCRRPPAP